MVLRNMVSLSSSRQSRGDQRQSGCRVDQDGSTSMWCILQSSCGTTVPYDGFIVVYLFSPREAPRPHSTAPRSSASTRRSDGSERHPGHRPRSRAAVPRRARRRAAGLRRSGRPTPGSPSRPRRGCCRRSSGTGSSTAIDDGGYEAGPLFALYASRHEPADDLIHARPADARGDQRGDRRDRQPRRRPRQHRRPGRADRRDVPARHDQLGRRRRPAALLGARQGLLRRRRHPRPAYDDGAPHRPHHHRPRPCCAASSTQVRRQGYAEALGELEIGLDAIAAPVYDRDGEVVAAVGISGPSDRLNHGASAARRAADVPRPRAVRASSDTSPRKEGAA